MNNYSFRHKLSIGMPFRYISQQRIQNVYLTPPTHSKLNIRAWESSEQDLLRRFAKRGQQLVRNDEVQLEDNAVLAVSNF